MQGGKRKGAGRPAIAPELKKKSISLKIPNWLNKWLDEQKESKVSLIEKTTIHILEKKVSNFNVHLHGWMDN